MRIRVSRLGAVSSIVRLKGPLPCFLYCALDASIALSHKDMAIH